jgi:hypothetical protein
MCLSAALREAATEEWKSIEREKEQHRIFWDFLREERNNIIHEYRWSAYERYLDESGVEQHPRPSLLLLTSNTYESDLVLRSGHFKGRRALEVIEESRQWTKERIFSLIDRAGLDPDEYRNIATFVPKPIVRGLLMRDSPE